VARLVDQQKEEESMGQGRWISVEDRLPAKGVYACRVKGSIFAKPGEVKVLPKKHIGGYWMGGVRPFSEKDIVTHWWESESK